LTRLETARRNALELAAKLEASETGRLPALKVLETASVPQRPWRPDYLRDGLFNLLASFLFGLLAMWFVELFNRMPESAAAPALGLPHAWMEPSMPMEETLAAPVKQPQLAHKAMPQLEGQASLPRELTQDEVSALLAGADGSGRLLCGTLLLGLTVDEIKALTVGDADLAHAHLSVPGVSARVVALPEWLAHALAPRADAALEQPLFRNALGQALGAVEIDAAIACAALDAGLDAAAGVTPEVLRHTCIVNVVRQNARFSSLAALVGQLSAGELTAYANLFDTTRRAANEAVDPIMPALRAFVIA
jgi:succinoglycan biosynthesis transport protein ExoP